MGSRVLAANPLHFTSSQTRGVSPLGLTPRPQVTSAPPPTASPFYLGACADPVGAPGAGERKWGRDLARMGAEPPPLTDSLTERPGRSLLSRSGGREGGGAGFPAGGAEPALEKEKEKGGQGGSGSHRPECQGPSRASRTPAGGRERPLGPVLPEAQGNTGCSLGRHCCSPAKPGRLVCPVPTHPGAV